MPRMNQISATLSQADADAAMEAIKATKVLLPFLINLSKETRRKQRKMGPKSVDYVNDCFNGGSLFTEHLPQNFPIKEFEKDVKLINLLNPLFVLTASLNEALSDTVMALGSDCMAQADEVYDVLKSAAKRDGNVKAQVDQIAKRFKGQGKKKVTNP